jgi:hypothetical protein
MGKGAMNGLWDQAMALERLQNNLIVLGGNPGDITIFGESAGSESVCMLSVSPIAKGLFKRAILQSGECIHNPWMRGVPSNDIEYARTAVQDLINADIIHQRHGYLGEWANADKIDLLILLLNFRIVRQKVKLLEIDAFDDRTELTSI